MKVAAEVYGVKEGMVFGHRTVLGSPFIVHGRKRVWSVVARCQCGKVSVVAVRELSKSTSCSNCPARHANSKSKQRLYGIWRSIKKRCVPHNCPWYGARGIRICDEWKTSYEVFRDWAMKFGYQDDLTIERIDVNGHYEPHNCCWIPAKDQSRNRRCIRYLVCRGVRKPLWQWAIDSGVNKDTLETRLARGWSPEEAIETPVDARFRNKATA